MKIKFRLYHYPVYISVFIGLALVLHLYLAEPRDSLYDYALTMEEGQFVSETGYIYETVADFPESERIFVKRIGEAKGYDFKVNFKKKPAEDLLPHEFTMHMNDYGSVYISSDGSVWCDTRDDRSVDRALLVQYLSPAREFNAEGAAELRISGGSLQQNYTRDPLGRSNEEYNYYSLSLDYISLYPSVPSADYVDTEFSVKLKDGWYAITSNDRHQKNILLPNVGFDTATTAQCRLTTFNTLTGEVLGYDEFKMSIKPHTVHIDD